MAYEFRLRRRVEFNETDAAGIVYFANFFRYCEATEAAFLRFHGSSLHRNEGSCAWPRVEVRCRYLRPAHFEDELEIHLLVAGKSEKSIDYLFNIYVDPDGDRILAAQASFVVVCASKEEGSKRHRARPLPADIAALIEEAPPTLLAGAPTRPDRSLTPAAVMSPA